MQDGLHAACVHPDSILSFYLRMLHAPSCFSSGHSVPIKNVGRHFAPCMIALDTLDWNSLNGLKPDCHRSVFIVSQTQLYSYPLDLRFQYFQGRFSLASLRGSLICTPSVLGSSLFNGSPLRALPRLVFPARSWPISSTLTRLSYVLPFFRALR